MDLNVLAGSVETLAGTQFGHLRIQLPTGVDSVPVVEYLHSQGVSVRATGKDAA
jgi:D-methionine transport system ATP-binding protein